MPRAPAPRRRSFLASFRVPRPPPRPWHLRGGRRAPARRGWPARARSASGFVGGGLRRGIGLRRLGARGPAPGPSPAPESSPGPVPVSSPARAPGSARPSARSGSMSITRWSSMATIWSPSASSPPAPGIGSIWFAATWTTPSTASTIRPSTPPVTSMTRIRVVVGDLEHLAEAAGEVEDRQHPSAEVDQPLDETPRRRRHPGRRVADDLLHVGDGQPVALAVQREHDELALHLRLRVAGGAHEASLP